MGIARARPDDAFPKGKIIGLFIIGRQSIERSSLDGAVEER
jgi:hypothetical protein